MKTKRSSDPLSRLQTEKSVRISRGCGEVEFVRRANQVTVLAFPPGAGIPSRTLSRRMPRSMAEMVELADEALATSTG